MEVEKTSVVDGCPKQRCFESPFFFGAEGRRPNKQVFKMKEQKLGPQ